MLIRHATDISPSEITPAGVWRRRRELVRAAVGADLLGSALRVEARGEALAKLAARRGAFSTMERQTAFELVTNYCNFYEFGTDKEDPAREAPGRLRLRPWRVLVDGEVRKPTTFDIDDLMKLAPLEERVYRLRCVEAWSAVIPGWGFHSPNSPSESNRPANAKYVEFTTLADRAQMPGVSSPVLDWPYTGGLRIDEAMHPLVLLTFGLYGALLPSQNGAPVRIVVPWKYGFKSAKSLVRIHFVGKEPLNSWQIAAPREYGFYSNLNPTVDHPRWSQASERRLGEDGLFNKRRPTQMFNGYGDQVAQLYAGMDLRNFY